MYCHCFPLEIPPAIYKRGLFAVCPPLPCCQIVDDLMCWVLENLISQNRERKEIWKGYPLLPVFLPYADYWSLVLERNFPHGEGQLDFRSPTLDPEVYLRFRILSTLPPASSCWHHPSTHYYKCGHKTFAWVPPASTHMKLEHTDLVWLKDGQDRKEITRYHLALMRLQAYFLRVTASGST